MTANVIGFRLEIIAEDGIAFFECDAPGCRGCGCPSFRYDGAFIHVPPYVIDYLLAHVELNHHHA